MNRYLNYRTQSEFLKQNGNLAIGSCFCQPGIQTPQAKVLILSALPENDRVGSLFIRSSHPLTANQGPDYCPGADKGRRGLHIEFSLKGGMTGNWQGQCLPRDLQQSRTRSATGFALGIILLGVFVSAPVHAMVFTVNSAADENDANPGHRICETAPGNGICTLRAAIQETNALPEPTMALSISSEPMEPGVFSVATANVGAAGSITASADMGSAALPVSIILCETNPVTGQCISTIGPSVMTQMDVNATPTFGIFVQGNGNVPRIGSLCDLKTTAM